jgi:hypothetical protein
VNERSVAVENDEQLQLQRKTKLFVRRERRAHINNGFRGEYVDLLYQE